MQRTALNIHSAVARKAYAKMIAKLFTLWKLSTEDELLLLGLRSHRTARRYRQGASAGHRADKMERIGHLLAIHRSLRMLFPHERRLVYAWIKLPNKDFGDLRPLDIMLQDGIAGIAAVRRYLEHERER
jgi:hypothetical protein